MRSAHARAGTAKKSSGSRSASARLHRFRGESTLTLCAFVQTALEISVDGGAILNELLARSSLATLAADAGDALQALPHLERCRQIVAAGENWLGIAGSVERAEAVVAAAQGEYPVADTRFKKAIATFQHYCLRGSRHLFNTGAARCSQPATAHAPSKSSTRRSRSIGRTERARCLSNT